MFRRRSQAGLVVENFGAYGQDVAGESHHRSELARAERRLSEEERRDGRGYLFARLVREPKNAYDPNAVRVELDGRLAGYIPRGQAAGVSAWLAAHAGKDVWVRAVLVWRTDLPGSDYGVWLDLPATRELDAVEWLPLEGASVRSRHERGAAPARPGVVELWPAEPRFDAEGKGSVGYRFATGGVSGAPEGSAWGKLGKAGLRAADLQVEDFRPGQPLRLALGATDKNPDAVTVWAGQRDVVVGYLTPSAAKPAGQWLKEGGARAFATAEWWEEGQRTNLGVLIVPAAVEVEFLGRGLPTAAEAISEARAAFEEAQKAAEVRAAAHAAATSPRELARFGSLVAKAFDGKATAKDSERISFLADELSDRLQEERADGLLEVLGPFKLPPLAAAESETSRDSLTDALATLVDAADELTDEWPDADREYRDDLRDQLSDAASDLLELFRPETTAVSEPAAAKTPVDAQATTPPQAPSLPPAAWYPNPSGPGQRYWDGQSWTEHFAP